MNPYLEGLSKKRLYGNLLHKWCMHAILFYNLMAANWQCTSLIGASQLVEDFRFIAITTWKAQELVNHSFQTFSSYWYLLEYPMPKKIYKLQKRLIESISMIMRF
jgi:hypothetical protein